MKTLMVFSYTLGVCLVVWIQHKLVCENYGQYASITPDLHSFWEHLPIYGIVEILLLWCFH
jgi:hypothetical protein